MCKHTYHHYPSCGHISNWSMTSCQEYTNKLRLASPECITPCTQITLSHDLLFSAQPSIDDQIQSSNSYQLVDAMDDSQIIQVNARMVSNPAHGERDTSSTDHSDIGQVFLGAAVGDSVNGNVDSAGHSDNGQICLRAVVSELEEDCGSLARSDNSSRTAFKLAPTNPSTTVVAGDLDSILSTIFSRHEKDNVETESPGIENAVCASPTNTSICDTDSSGSSLCGSSLIRYNILKLRIDEYLEKRQRQREVDTDHEQHNAKTSDVDVSIYLADIVDPHLAVKDTPPEDPVDNPEADHHSCDESALDIDLVQQRIEATVLKRIEETNEKEARQEAISKLLDTALLKKDQDDRREWNAELGIEEDPHMWDTECLDQIWQTKGFTTATPADASIPISPRTCISPKTEHALPIPAPDPQPQKHLYMGSMFASEEQAYQRGLCEVRPYGNYPGECEGFMLALSEDDANQQGLLDPIHVRGCCAERQADFHLYYGAMQAPSEVDAEKRWLEDIRRIPGENGKFYGLLRADDLHHARAMGLTDISHPWGCCKEGLFTMPERVRHRYTGFMCAVSLEQVGRMGLCDAEPVPGECGDYYGGTYYGYLEAYSELDAFQMGLKEPEHDEDCCVKAEVADVSITEAGQYTYYGYMYAGSEEEVVNRGLEDVLLVPGFDIKYSGNLRAESEEEAKALGLLEPSRIQ
ncbi:unnamed protein product [Penicillium crustosum]